MLLIVLIVLLILFGLGGFLVNPLLWIVVGILFLVYALGNTGGRGWYR
jgi:hypothetical protein